MHLYNTLYSIEAMNIAQAKWDVQEQHWIIWPGTVYLSRTAGVRLHARNSPEHLNLQQQLKHMHVIRVLCIVGYTLA